MRPGYSLKFLTLVVLLVIAGYCSLVYGGSGVLDFSHDGNDFILWQLRVPKTVTAVLAGISLAVSGLILQLIFRNPLAGPYVLGVSSGASLFVALSALAGGALGLLHNYPAGRALTISSAIAGGSIVTLVVLVVSGRVRNNVILLLAGLMFSLVCGAIQTSLEYFADPASLKLFVVWGMGSLSSTTLNDLPALLIVCLLALIPLFFMIRPLNALLLGEDYARSLGVDYARNRFWLLLSSSVLTGVVTAFCGPIAFVGIAVPVLSRMIFHTAAQQIHLFSCMMLGAILLLTADAISHSVIRGTTLPVNMITTLIGAPLVLYLLFRQNKW